MNEPNLEEDIKGEPEEILNLTDVFDNEEAPDGVDIDAVERNVTSTFQDYMQELLTQPKVKTEEEKESKMQARPDAHITSMQVSIRGGRCCINRTSLGGIGYIDIDGGAVGGGGGG